MAEQDDDKSGRHTSRRRFIETSAATAGAVVVGSVLIPNLWSQNDYINQSTKQKEGKMKTIGIEEHFVTDAVAKAWSQLEANTRYEAKESIYDKIEEKLYDLGDIRLAEMDKAGLDVAVISLTTPALNVLPAAEATALQVETNDLIAQIIKTHPDRFQGFATLAFPAPAAAASELRRAVTKLGLNGAMICGRTGERNLDHADNWQIFEAAESLRVPLYIHPQAPQERVRAAMYSGYGGQMDLAFACHGVGWHYESGIQFLRLAIAGVFDRFPNLQVILGHWGENSLFFLERCDQFAHQFKLPHTFSEYVRRNAYITPGGVYSQRYLKWAVEVVGAERIMFATDYPYQPGPEGGVEHFLNSSGLDQASQVRIASGNWDAIVAGIRR